MVLAQAGDPDEAQAALLDSVSCQEPGKGPHRLAAIRWASQSRAQALEKIRVARAEGSEAARLVYLRRSGQDGPLDSRPWPALCDGCLLWWPEAEYDRLVRQVSQATHFLGARWSDHTAIVESAIRTAAAVPAEPASLVAATFDDFTTFLLAQG